MNLEQKLRYLANALREENVPNFFVAELANIAEEVGDLEWRVDGLED